MEYRSLGKTGLRVSPVGFGGAPIGIPGYLSDDDRDSVVFRQRAISALQRAVALGVNYFDTAPGYGDGRSESLFGAALEECRDEVLIATKYPFEERASWSERTAHLQASLERLRTDHVDVLQLHGEFFDDALAERILQSGVLDWAEEMRARGLCRFTGITAEGPSGGLERLLHTGRFDVLEIAYNLIYQSTCDYQREPAGIIPLARSLGIGITTMRPTTSGFLQKLFDRHFPWVDTDRLTLLAINYVLSTPEVDCVVIGMRKPEEVVAAVRLADDPAKRLNLRALHDRFAR